MGDVATFVTSRAAGSTLRETLSPVRWPGGPWWDGRPGGTPVLRGCGGGVRRRAYLWGLPSVKQNPARHATAWPRTIPETSSGADGGEFLVLSGGPEGWGAMGAKADAIGLRRAVPDMDRPARAERGETAGSAPR
jgi:hypothetical protein